MATTTTPDVTALKTEIERLRAGLDAAVDKMRALNGGAGLEGYDSALATAEKMWTGVKRQAQQVGHGIEERPLVSALTAFGVGVAIGMLFGGRRG
jgi:hypothetical protein